MNLPGIRAARCALSTEIRLGTSRIAWWRPRGRIVKEIDSGSLTEDRQSCPCEAEGLGAWRR
jgi:hypothetical protein